MSTPPKPIGICLRADEDVYRRVVLRFHVAHSMVTVIRLQREKQAPLWFEGMEYQVNKGRAQAAVMSGWNEHEGMVVFDIVAMASKENEELVRLVETNLRALGAFGEHEDIG